MLDNMVGIPQGAQVEARALAQKPVKGGGDMEMLSSMSCALNLTESLVLNPGHRWSAS